MRVPLDVLHSWGDDQVDWLLAFQDFRDGLGSNGFPLSETTSPRANPDNYSGGYRYVALPPRTDWAKKAELDAMDAYREAQGGEKTNMNGLIFDVQRVDYTPIAEGASLEGL